MNIKQYHAYNLHPFYIIYKYQEDTIYVECLCVCMCTVPVWDALSN